MPEVSDEILEVFREVFDDPSLVVSSETTASDVPNWDSMMHVSLMLAVERQFGIRFSSSEVAGLKNVGELQMLVDQRRGGAQ
jgi:acyl carrier protein